MPVLLILASLLFVSCKKENVITNRMASSSNLEQRSYMTINHDENKSLIRSKILNGFVEEKFISNDKDNRVNHLDELKGYNLDSVDMKKYADNEKFKTKLIVSYTDHLEIYFLPENMPVSSLINKLGLKPEADRIFRWSKNEMVKTYAGGELMLASVNKEDMVVNDQAFYEEAIDLKNQFAQKKIKSEAGKKIQIKIDYEFFIQKEKEQEFTGKSLKCSRDLMEAGMCGKCTYKKHVPMNDYQVAVLPRLEDLNLVLNIGGQVVSIADLESVQLNDKEFGIVLDAEDNEIEVVSLKTAAQVKHTPGYNYGDTCIDRYEGTGNTEFQTRADLSVEVKIMGRGEKFFRNFL